MAKISLRAYNREIETLIERGQSEEAIAHCKFILKSYPKHLDTYRLLGKAFLETQRYSEAADILLRILSVQPDDFVSQIGMSIIREDEGNLDAALFHMERAFEIQPSNAAIQDELRRLYGRRDGVEPPKLRLTRGALVRMYARGDLYRQATAEARATLAEDNQRLDIQIILARMYFLTGQKAEAAEISSKLVSKLPYCFEANRILADVLPETSRAEDAKIYQQHLLALDPYLAYLSETAPTPNQIPDQVITLDRLEWTPSLDENEQPSWANSLGISIDTREEPKAEDWRSPFEAPAEPEPGELPAQADGGSQNAPESSDPISNQKIQTQELGDELNELPSWMSSAGWGLSDQPSSEEPSPLLEPTSESEEEPAPAEMPDWLKNLAPAGESSTPAEDEQQKLDWLTSILPEETASTPVDRSIEVTQPNAAQTVSSDSPLEAGAPVNEDLPDWLRSIGTSNEEPTIPTQLSEEPLPDWLTESEEDVPPVDASPSAEVLPSASLNEPVDLGPVELLPEQNIAQEEPPKSDNMSMPDLSNMDDAMAWLESLAVKQGADEEALVTKPEDRLETPPEWIVAAAQEEETNASEVLPQSQANATLPQQEGQDTAQDNEFSMAQIEPSEIIAGPADVTSPENEMPDAVTLGVEQRSEISPEEPIADQNLSNALVDQDQLETVQAATEQVSNGEEPGTDLDSAFAWLESLAAKQGAESDTLLVAPEERFENPPDWIKEQSSEIELDQSLPQETPIQGSMENAKVSDELTESTEAENANLQSADLPEWIKPVDSSIDEDATTMSPEGLPVEDTSIGYVSQAESAEWIQEQESTLTPRSDSGESVEELPAEQQEPAEPVAGKTGPLPHWLASSAQEIEPQPVAEPAEPELPDWLQDHPQTSSAPTEHQGEPAEPETPPLPDWLQNIEPEKIEVPLPQSMEATPAVEPVALDLSAEPADLLGQAQQALGNGQVDSALTAYNALIQKDEHLEDTIHDLKDALYRFPVESSIWQTLGDALFRTNRVQDALDAYTKAEELLK